MFLFARASILFERAFIAFCLNAHVFQFLKARLFVCLNARFFCCRTRVYLFLTRVYLLLHARLFLFERACIVFERAFFFRKRVFLLNAGLCFVEQAFNVFVERAFICLLSARIFLFWDAHLF